MVGWSIRWIALEASDPGSSTPGTRPLSISSDRCEIMIAMMMMMMMRMFIVLDGRWFSRPQLRTGWTLKTPYALSFARGHGQSRQKACLRFYILLIIFELGPGLNRQRVYVLD